MRTPKFTALDLHVLFNVTGGKSATAQKLELTAALDSLKSGIAALARDSGDDKLPLLLFLALQNKKDGGSGAPAEIGLPQAPLATPAAIAAKPAALYAN